MSGGGIEKKKPEACHKPTFVWSDHGRCESSKISGLSLSFMSRRFPANFDYCNAVVAVGSWNHFGIMDGRSMEFLDFHESFLEYKRM